jgi:hypothetical protein
MSGGGNLMIQMPVITAIKPERQSKGLDDLRCWHVAYRFCGLTAEIIVYAQDDAEARAKAVHQQRILFASRSCHQRNPYGRGTVELLDKIKAPYDKHAEAALDNLAREAEARLFSEEK